MKSWPMACFRCNTKENLVFSLKYCQRKVDLNTSKKSLVFVTIRHTKYHIHISYTKISYLRKYTHFRKYTHLRKDAAFLHFRLKETKYISVKRKHTKASKIMIFSVLFKTFHKTKILFFMQCEKERGLGNHTS